MFKIFRKLGSPHGYVIDQFSLGVSLFPKSGSSSLKYLLFEAEHGRTFERKKQHIHQWAAKNRIASLENCKYRLILIRDPIERFISCYNNKVIQQRHLDYMDIGSLSLSDPKREFPFPSLDEFVDNFSEMRKLPVINHHTKPISEFLQRRNLNFFSEVFTFDQIDILAKRINQIAATDVTLFHFQKSEKHQWAKARKRGDLSQLSQSQIIYLMKLYSSEYHFLNPYYSKNEILKKWEMTREAIG